MKIVYIVKSLALKAGVERVLIDKMNYLSDVSGYDLTVITYEQGVHPISFPLSKKVKHIDLHLCFYLLYQYGIMKRIWCHLKMRNSFRKQLRQHIDQINPDIILCTTYSYALISIITQIGHHSKKIIETHIERNSLERDNSFGKIKALSLLNKMYNKYILKQIKKCDALVTLTQADALLWKDTMKTIVIPNPLTYYPPQINDRSTSKQIISAGRLDPQKGYDLLIKAWERVAQQHPDWKLVIYGSGYLKEELMDEIRKKHLESTLTLYPATAHIYDKYMESAFYVMSSRFEGFGLVLSEAMSCGLPCVSFNCPYGPSEIIRNNEDGLLVENENYKKLADSICHLITHPQERKQMGERARKNVKRYLLPSIMPQWEELFSQLLSNHQINNKQYE